MSTNSLLLDEQPLIILPKLATLIGLNEAIALQQVHYWVELNRKAGSKRHYHDGRWWTYNTLDQWHENFPFWSRRTVRRTLDRLKEKGLILCGNYNARRYDQTLWYTVDYDHLDKIATPCGQNDHMDVDKVDSSACGQDDHMKVDKVDTPIPETNTESTSENTAEKGGADAPVSPPASEADELFDEKAEGEKRPRQGRLCGFKVTTDPVLDMVQASDLGKERAVPDWAVLGPEGPHPAFQVVAEFCRLTRQSPETLGARRGKALLRHYQDLGREYDLTVDQMAQAHQVLHKEDWGGWYIQNHKWSTGYEQKYIDQLVLAASQIKDGRLEVNGDGEIVEDVPTEEMTGTAMLLARQRERERKMREAGEPVPKGLWDR